MPLPESVPLLEATAFEPLGRILAVNVLGYPLWMGLFSGGAVLAGMYAARKAYQATFA